MGSNSEFTGGPYPNVDQVITFVPGEKKLIEVYGYEPDGEVKASYEGQTFRKLDLLRLMFRLIHTEENFSLWILMESILVVIPAKKL